LINKWEWINRLCAASVSLATIGIAAYPAIAREFGAEAARDIVFSVFFSQFETRENAEFMTSLFDKEMAKYFFQKSTLPETSFCLVA
jgi:hypothetical protein